MQRLIHRRCHYHPQREAVARCPECDRYFCRECITEHGDRVVCTVCLRQLSNAADRVRSPATGGLLKVFQAIAGIFILWMSFYYFGQLLLSVPSSFHEGTIWKTEDRGKR